MNYFERLIDVNDTASSKRFIGLVAFGHFAITSFYITFAPRTNANTELLDRILLYDVIIISVSLFGLAIEKIVEILLSISKTKAAAQILTPSPVVNQVETVEGDIKGGQGEVKEPVQKTDQEIADEGDAAHDMREIKKNLTDSLKPKKEIIG